MDDFHQNLFDSNRVSVEFLKTELDTGLMFSKMALTSDNDEKSDRNRKHARTAYDALLRFIGRVSLTLEDAEHLKAGIAELKSQLQRLGETF